MDADILRYILIVVGAILILALYLWERSREPPEAETQPDEDAASSKREPSLGGLEDAPSSTLDSADAWPEETGDAAAADAALDDYAASDSHPIPLLIQLGVVSIGDPFVGSDLLEVAMRCGLEPGDMDIFHARDEAGVRSFSMANIVKPGTFSFDAMETFESPGLMLFSQLDGTSRDMEVLDEMLAAARQLATALGGEVLDEARNPLTVKQEEVLRSRIQEHVMRGGVA